MPSVPLRPERIFLGTCAWSFDDWRNVFYPNGWPRNRWLGYYASRFRAVEMDSSFYHLPSAQTVEHWNSLTPPGFRFCPKVPRTLTHEKRLSDPGPQIAMMSHLAANLGERMGCALLQLPPSFHARPDEEKLLRQFLARWPREIRLAVEFRHESWETAHAAAILERHGVAWVWTDILPLDRQSHAGIGFLPVTAPFLYIRLLGDLRDKYRPDGSVTHRYGRLLWPRDTALAHWASKVRVHGEADTVHIFANNHYEGMAVETAGRLAGLLGCPAPAQAPPPVHEEQQTFPSSFDDPAG